MPKRRVNHRRPYPALDGARAKLHDPGIISGIPRNRVIIGKSSTTQNGRQSRGQTNKRHATCEHRQSFHPDQVRSANPSRQPSKSKEQTVGPATLRPNGADTLTSLPETVTAFGKSWPTEQPDRAQHSERPQSSRASVCNAESPFRSTVNKNTTYCAKNLIPSHSGPNIPAIRGPRRRPRNLLKRRGDAHAVAIPYIQAMKQFRAILLAPLALTFGLSAHAAEVPLDTLSSYLNSLTTAEAQFVQTNADGSTATGRIIIQRPGRARFEYDKPVKNLVLASDNMVAIFDSKSNQAPEQYPLERTPLNLILAPHVDLNTAAMVVNHGEVQGATHVLAQDPKHPDYGTIELVFSEAPVALTKWIISDDIGNQTSVALGPFKVGGTYSSKLFSITLEAERRGPSR
ncbi:MAG: LolA family protein [Cypionkella sp.]